VAPGNATIAHIAHFALLNQCIQEEQEQATALKQVFGHTPHNFVDHLLFHMAGVIQSPGATPNQRALSLQINRAINNVKTWLGQVRQDWIYDNVERLATFDVTSHASHEA
jgi:hypothetical protein